jgi:hypothetical protein
METDYGDKIDNWNPETQTVEELDGYYAKLVEQKALDADQDFNFNRNPVAKEHLMMQKLLNGEIYLQSPSSIELGYAGYIVWAIDFNHNCLLVRHFDDRKIISVNELLRQFEKAREDEYEELPHMDKYLDSMWK